MNRQSIFFSITLSFVISLVLVGISYVLLIKEVEKKDSLQSFSKYRSIGKILRFENNPKEIKETLDSFGLVQIVDKATKDEILSKQNLVFPKKRFKHPKQNFKLFSFKNNRYILLRIKGEQILLKETKNINEFKLFVKLIFSAIFLVLILSFFFTIKKLYPLKALQKRVKSIGEENFDAIAKLTCKKDEVSILSNEFAKSSQNLKQIKEARNIFFRNIMHELKTPIAKGKFLLELENTQENLAKQKDIFNRLDLLINEFASIEATISKSTEPKMEDFYIADIIENVEDILLLDETSLHVNIQNQPLHVNFKTFSIALKNLVDNALKYSTNKKATICNEGKNIIIKNSGKKLPKDLKSYKEPYNNIYQNRQNSLGLGLYIATHLLEANNYTLKYAYKSGENIFTCKAK